MNIKILGTGCPNCQRLYAATEKAAKEMNLDVELEKVEEIPEIMKYGVMGTPALVINEKVKSYGRVLGVDEIKKYIEDEK